MSVHVDDDPLDALLAAAALEASDPTDACPEEPELTACLEGRLDDDALARIDRHLLSCDRCRGAYERLAFGIEPPPEIAPETIWGSAISIAMFGPENAPARAIRRALKALADVGATVSPPDDELAWAALEVGSGALSGDPIDGRKLARWLRQVQGHIDPGGPVGALVTAGRGIIGRRGPFGVPYDDARDRAGTVSSGALLVTPEVAAILEGLGVGLYRDAVGPFRQVMPAQATASWTDWLPAERGGFLRALYVGVKQSLAGLGLELSAVRSDRSAPVRGAGAGPGGSALPSAPIVLQNRDYIQVRYVSPERSWLYLLIESDGRLTAHAGGAPVRSPGQAASGTAEIKIPAATPSGRIHLLASLSPLPDLDDLVTVANADETSGEPVDRLGRLLLEQRALETFAIVPAASYTSAP